jgi:hypothetical protein
MGMIFQAAEHFLPPASADCVFVEIGSDRYEGSTRHFAKLAVDKQTVLHTVDITNDPQIRIEREGPIAGIVWHQGVGSEWAKNVFPVVNKKISCLYLDNFDYDWNVTVVNQDIQDQKKMYREHFGIVMNNQNCQVEHLKQMLALYPFMAQNSTIICDDTYLSNDCWIGKCGAVVTFLLVNGYRIVSTEAVGGLSYGVILVRDTA